MSATPGNEYPPSNIGYREHWSRLSERLEVIRRGELRRQGPNRYAWDVIDSLLQLGYLHGNRMRSTGLIQWQRRIADAYARKGEKREG